MENKKKIYALLLESPDITFLSVQYAQSLEQAFAQAKLDYQENNPLSKGGKPLLGPHIGLFVIKTVDELVEESNNFNLRKKTHIEKEKKLLKSPPKKFERLPKPVIEAVKKINEATEKNIFIKKIIDNKDIKSFEENKNIFTENERKYIEERLNGNVKN